MKGIACSIGFALATALSAAQALEGQEPPRLTVPKGFSIQVAAAPPLVRYPMMACLDDRGRLFIAESDGQNLKKAELLEQQPRFIRLLEDTDRDGVFDKSTIFADKMVMPEGALWHDGALYVVSAPYLWRLEDADGDGVAEKREALIGAMEFDGRANQHGPYLGPEGRLYFSGGHFGYDLVARDGTRSGASRAAGLFSCRPDGTDLEVVGHAGVNPVEVVFSPEGEMFSTCAIFDYEGGRADALIHWIPGATYGPQSFGVPLVRQTGYRLPAAHRWGQVAPAGLVRYRGTAFGAEYRDNLFACHFNTHNVVRIRLERDGSTYRCRSEDFLTSTATDFHPADVLEDADGSLLVLDTGGWLSWGCPTSKLAKPNVTGAIYRIRKVGAPTITDPYGLREKPPPAALLDDDRPAVLDRAMAALVKGGEANVPALQKALQLPSATARRNAVWALCRIGASSAPALEDADESVRHAAIQAAGHVRDLKAVGGLMQALGNESPAVRRAAATALGRMQRPDAVGSLLEALGRGGDEHLLHALTDALIRIGHPESTRLGLADRNPSIRRAALVALDQMTNGNLRPEEVTPHLDPMHPTLHETALRIIASRPGWASGVIDFVGRGLDREPQEDSPRRTMTGVLVAYSNEPAIQELVARKLRQERLPVETRLFLLEAMAQARPAKVPAVWIAEMRWSLESSDVRVVRQSIATVRSSRVDAIDEALLNLTKDAARPEELRLEALAVVAPRLARLEPSLMSLLLAGLNREKSPLIRLTAAGTLGVAPLSDDQLARLPLSSAGALEFPKLVAAFARSGSASAGDALVGGLEKSLVLESLGAATLRLSLARYPEEIRRRAEPLFRRLEADAARQGERLAQIEMGLAAGSAARGKSVFFGNRAACWNCHRVAGQGGRIGPDLSQVGQIRTRRDLLESVVFPSATLVNGYETYLLKTRDGAVHDGVIARETAEAIYLYSPDRTEARVPRASVEEMRQSRLSIMPQGLDAQLSTVDLSDLLAYLQSLK